jgi:hypothetical protein
VNMQNLELIAFRGIILIGTVHGDPRGFDRAAKLLEYLRPDLITVEIAPFSVRYRAAHQAGWRRLFDAGLARLPGEAGEHPAIRRVAAQIEMPFEWRAAHAYGRRAGASWRAIDLSGPARRHLPLYAKELLAPENLQRLWETPEEPWEEQVAAAYQRARLAANRPLWRPPGGNGGLTRLREGAMAARIRKLAEPGRRLVHLGGWEHLAPREDGGGLAVLSEDLQPLRLLLDESDGLPT